MKGRQTRAQIVEAADQLFYRQGFAASSFADIARKVGISRGNFYYHFQTKDEILGAVIAQRQANTCTMLDRWEHSNKHPADRIREFIDILTANGAKIVRHGCPVGTLCSELAKLNHAAKDQARDIFTLFRNWLSRQFLALGHDAEADNLAIYLLACSQGAATLANAYQDDAFLHREADRLGNWLNQLSPTRP